MNALVDRYGGVEATAALISSRWGCGTEKGLISKKMSGSAGWLITDALALQRAVKDDPITRLLQQQSVLLPEEIGQDLHRHAEAVTKESGEASTSLLRAIRTTAARDVAAAIVEINESLEALSSARDALIQQHPSITPIKAAE